MIDWLTWLANIYQYLEFFSQKHGIWSWMMIIFYQLSIELRTFWLFFTFRFISTLPIFAGLINEFSTAAMRVGHAMVPGKFDRYSQDFVKTSSVPVRDTFFKSNFLYQDGAVDELVRGLAQQQGKIIENRWIFIHICPTLLLLLINVLINISIHLYSSLINYFLHYSVRFGCLF